jgi:hypothetical protein
VSIKEGFYGAYITDGETNRYAAQAVRSEDHLRRGRVPPARREARRRAEQEAWPQGQGQREIDGEGHGEGQEVRAEEVRH